MKNSSKNNYLNRKNSWNNNLSNNYKNLLLKKEKL